jgi:hypothetical protein
MKVYIGKMPDGGVIVDVNPQVLRDAEILASMPMEEYQALGHHSVDVAIEDGKPVVRLKDAVAKKVEIAKCKSRLEQIDRDAGAGRAFRAIAIEVARLLHETDPANVTFDPANSRDLKKIIDAENVAIQVRAEMAPLLAG